MSLAKLKNELQKLVDPQRAKLSQRFFKTDPGEYGEGDKFLGIKNPIQRQMAKKYKDLKLDDLQKLLNSKYHDYRSIALMILILQFAKAKDEKNKQQIYDFYLKNTKNINNWDLVDISAPHIVGQFLLDKDRQILYKLAKSPNQWEKRIAMLATYTFIRNNDFSDALKISEILVDDKHDLIHKAVGWMLREIGKRDQIAEESFLKKYYQTMPRTMLRYAIEKFDPEKRDFYLDR